MNESKFKTDFDRDVEDHVMTVIRDDGVNRHIRFAVPGTGIMHFDLITWPGHLCYTGDMGTYVFKRLDDMFEFFRAGGSRVNLSYWSEKLQASACSGRYAEGVTEFDEYAFIAFIRKQRLEWIREAKRENKLTKDKRRDLWEELGDLIDMAGEGRHLAMRSAYEFSWSGKSTGMCYCFNDIYEYKFESYTHQFQWCCHALEWAIQVYDAQKPAANLTTTGVQT